MGNVSWPAVVLLSVLSVCLFGAVTVLAINGRDVAATLSAVSAFLVLIVTALGLGKSQQIDTKLEAVHEQGNGRISALQDQNRAMQDQNKELQDTLLTTTKELHEKITALALQLQPSSPPISSPPSPPAPAESP